jgi:hypothetical protein
MIVLTCDGYSFIVGFSVMEQVKGDAQGMIFSGESLTGAPVTTDRLSVPAAESIQKTSFPGAGGFLPDIIKYRFFRWRSGFVANVC